ncbi:hypothetical protein Taro_003228 [Colocasia esculenta]|uniref:Uncharacterized protein n=1 Tax=Colocasia esculenta TaxID=4460 RepID=A0A843TLF9_COLES|nr:hypothetical protein [Colocasia esculenta]
MIYMFIFSGTTFSCKGSVDTTISGVDTMAQSKDRNVKKRSTSVDASPGQVDTRDRSQRNMLTGFYLRASQKSRWWLEEFSSLFLSSWCFLKPNSHLFKYEKWKLIIEEAIGSLKEVDQKSPVSPSSSFSKEAQRKGAKEIHKYFMAKRSLNESKKSTIHKVLALTAHSKSSQHSSSSSEHKSSNGSKRSGKSTPDPFVYSNSDSDEDESSVDTTISGVDTMAQSKDRNVKKRSTSVDTSPGQEFVSRRTHCVV